MFSVVWYTFLYQPLFNILIWLYSHVAQENLGWAVVALTILLRIILLPLTIIEERNAIREQLAGAEAEKVLGSYKGDKIAQHEAVRKIMRKHRISPWARVVSLGIQLLVLILLYQVFIQGIRGDKILKILYPSIDYPGQINTLFYGFEIGRVHDALWAGIVALYLFVAIYIEHRGRGRKLKPDALYWVAFPLFTFAVLWYLPMVKSLFILTTMIFSDIIHMFRRLLFSPKIKKVEAHH